MSAQYEAYKGNCVKAIDHFKKELHRLRSGRATPSILEGLQVEYYGSNVALQQLGLVAAPEPRMLTIQVYDQGAVASIEKAIQQSDLGLNPSRDGERRKELIKKVSKMTEETRVSLRNLRRDEIENVKKKTKAKEMSEDDGRKAQEEIQKILDKYIVDVDSAAAAKEKELMEV